MRLLLILFASLCLVLTLRSLMAHQQASQGPQAVDLLSARLQQLDQKHAEWRDTLSRPGVLPGERHTAQEALQTLQQLRSLYATEEHLWTYYDLLQHSYRIRSSYATGRSALEEQLAQQRRELHRVDELLGQLRNEPPHRSRQSQPFFSAYHPD